MATTKMAEYKAKAKESLAALDAATSEKDRAHHGRAYGIYRKLMDGIGEAEVRAGLRPPPKAAKAKG